MKICAITTVSKIMDWFVVDTMRYLHLKGADITLVCDMEDNFIAQNQDYAKCVPMDIERGVDVLGTFKAIIKMAKMFKTEKYDLIQYSAPSAALAASIAGLISGVKVRVYCQWGIRYVGFRGIKKQIFKLLEKLICLFSTQIEPDSKGNLEFGIREKLYKSDKAHVVWNGSASGIDLARFDIARRTEWRKEIRKKHELSENGFVFGFVGRVTRDKGINELVRAFQEIEEEYSDINLLLVGDTDEMNTLNSDIVTYLQSANNVTMTGRVMNTEKYLAAMDLFVLPSYREGFGSVILEAAAMGTPIITTDIPGPTDLIQNEYNGLLVEKKNTRELKNVMLLLMNSGEQRKQMADNAYYAAKTGYEQSRLFEYIYEDRKKLIATVEL